MVGLGLGLGLSQPVVAAGGGGEKFPDPTLAHVTDDVNGWSFSDGAPVFGPLGGTGPGISIEAPFADSTGALADGGTDDLAFAAATSNGATYTVAITIANYVSGSLTCQIRQGTAKSMGALSNGVITKTVVAGSGSTGTFILTETDPTSNDFDITHISVT